MREKDQFQFPVNAGDFQKPSFGWCGNRPQCVAVARKPEGVAVRDTKDSGNSTLFFDNDEWKAFVGAVKSGEFDV